MTNEQLNKEAERLIELFRPHADGFIHYDEDDEYRTKNAIQCAITHCDEMLNQLNNIEWNNLCGCPMQYKDHYQQLKQTLTNKLK